VYVIAPILGAVAAAFLYDAIATPRLVEQPIERAVTEPDRDLDPRATRRP
jgi:phosphate/sulfate permease